MKHLALQVRVALPVVALAIACPPAPTGEGEGEGEGEGKEGEGEGEGEGESNVGPSVVATTPAHGDSGVATNTAVSVQWSEPIDCNTVNETVAFLQAGAILASTIDCRYDATNDIMTFRIVPDAEMPAYTTISAAIFGNGTITDLEGAPMTEDVIWTFTTGAGADYTPPTIVSRFPDQGDVNVPLNASVSVSFSEPIACGGVNATTAFLSSGTARVSCQNTPDGSVTIDPDADFAARTTITATLRGTIADNAGNLLGADVVWTFETGGAADTTPPAAPNATTFPASTLFSTVTVSGDKDGAESTNVEAAWRVNGTLRQDFTQIVSSSTSTTWSADVSLEVGVNQFTIRSRDAANNVSATTSFSITRNPNPVNLTVDLITTPTTVNRQVIEGTKTAGTSVLLNGNIIVPLNELTTWDAEVTLVPGNNVLTFSARDGAGNTSDDVVEVITYNEPARLSQGEVKIDFNVISIFGKIGDESVADSTGESDINHLGYALWVEGPLTERSPGVPERCVFDDGPVFQRKYIRYVRTIAHSGYDRPPRSPGNGCNFNSPTPEPCNGYFWEPDGQQPNFMAALAASGVWASAPFPVDATTDRRDANGHYQNIVGGSFQFTANEMMFTNQNNINQPRLLQPGGPLVDGITTASINPHHVANVTPTLSCGNCADDQHCVDTDGVFQSPQGGAVECRAPLAGGFSTCTSDADCGLHPRCDIAQGRCEDAYGTPVCKDGTVSVNVGGVATCRGESLPDWHKRYSFRWDLTDRNGNRVRPGWYVIWLELVNDGINPGRSSSVWLNRMPQRDLETCWDDASHDTLGQHRVVALVHIDGVTGSTIEEVEKPFGRAVPACNTAALGVNNNIRCSCSAGQAWPCPLTPNTDGGNVHFLDPDLDGGNGAMRVQYCPTGACP